jgi:hypothetical protein
LGQRWSTRRRPAIGENLAARARTLFAELPVAVQVDALESWAGLDPPRRCRVPDMLERLSGAAEALNRGDPEPFVALMADGAEWRGVSSGLLWWKLNPS